MMVASTSNYELAACWICKKCGKHVVALISFEELVRGLPEPPQHTGFSEEDETFLKKGNVRFARENE